MIKASMTSPVSYCTIGKGRRLHILALDGDALCRSYGGKPPWNPRRDGTAAPAIPVPFTTQMQACTGAPIGTPRANDDGHPCPLYAAKASAHPPTSIPTQLADSRRLADSEGSEVVAEFSD